MISKMIDRRRVWRALLDYPVYFPPFRNIEYVPTRDEAEANYEYFLENKEIRRRHLNDYLASHSVHLSLDLEGLQALDRWIYRYGAHLVPRGDDVTWALKLYDPAWIDGYRGLNIINDISIYIGDYIISGQKDARWGMPYGDGKYDHEKPGFAQPCIFGIPHFGGKQPHSMLDEAYMCCEASYCRLGRGKGLVTQELDIPGELTRRITYLADPDPPRRIPFSQQTIDD